MESEVVELEVNVRPLKILDVVDGKLLAKSRKQVDFLLSENADLPIHIISIFGSAREGKSFLMNLLINYLKNNYRVSGDLNMSSGFLMDRKTGPTFNTVRVYPEIFKNKSKTGNEFGIMLMESQGLFDGRCADLMQLQFNVCKTISSVMMLNVKQEKIPISSLLDILEHGRHTGDRLTNHTHLILVMRDAAQQKIIDVPVSPDTLETYVQDVNKPIAEKMYQDLRQHFDRMSYFLIPKPSNDVIYHKFKGQTSRLPPNFMKAMNTLFVKITDNNQHLLTGSQLVRIFRHMTQLSAVHWNKYANALFMETGYSFYQDRPVEELVVKPEVCAVAKKPKKKKNKNKLKPNAAEVTSAIPVADLIDLNCSDLKNDDEEDGDESSLFDDTLESVSVAVGNVATKRTGSTTNVAQSTKSINLEQQPSTNELVESWLEKMSITASGTNDEEYHEKLIRANAYYSKLKAVTIQEVELHSNLNMAALLCRSDSLVGYRDLCTYIIQDTYKLSPKHETPEIHFIYKDQIKKEVIEKTYQRAIRLAIEDYKRYLLSNLDIDVITRSDIKVTHFDYKPVITTVFKEFWSGQEYLDELDSVLEREYFSVVKEICQKKLERQLNDITDVNNLFGIQQTVQSEFFPIFAWMDPNNKIEKEVLERILTDKVADKAIELLIKDCDQRFSNRLRNGNYRNSMEAFVDTITYDARIIMDNIDRLRFTDVVKEIDRIKKEYDSQHLMMT